MSLIARHLEANGIATLCMASALDIIAAGNPPRAVLIDYPLGHTAGKPFDAVDQYEVVRTSVMQFPQITEPGGIVHLANRWSDDENWRAAEVDSDSGDIRQPRNEEPQFQTDDDRRLAIASGALEA